MVLLACLPFAGFITALVGLFTGNPIVYAIGVALAASPFIAAMSDLNASKKTAAFVVAAGVLVWVFVNGLPGGPLAILGAVAVAGLIAFKIYRSRAGRWGLTVRAWSAGRHLTSPDDVSAQARGLVAEERAKRAAKAGGKTSGAKKKAPRAKVRAKKPATGNRSAAKARNGGRPKQGPSMEALQAELAQLDREKAAVLANSTQIIRDALAEHHPEVLADPEFQTLSEDAANHFDAQSDDDLLTGWNELLEKYDEQFARPNRPGGAVDVTFAVAHLASIFGARIAAARRGLAPLPKRPGR